MFILVDRIEIGDEGEVTKNPVLINVNQIASIDPMVDEALVKLGINTYILMVSQQIFVAQPFGTVVKGISLAVQKMYPGASVPEVKKES